MNISLQHIAAAPYLVRLNSDGSLDSTFTVTGSGLNGPVSSLAIDAVGRVVVGGAFTKYNGSAEPFVARINSDGTLDSTFAPAGAGLNSAVATVVVH